LLQIFEQILPTVACRQTCFRHRGKRTPEVVYFFCDLVALEMWKNKPAKSPKVQPPGHGSKRVT
jgi:hypothetical protein